MKILPPSQIDNLPILEEVLEELRLNIIDHIQHIAEALDLYSLDSIDLKRKLNLLGLSNINIGKFIRLDLNSDEFEYISPEFYKMYRKLNQHRGNKMSMDYIFHSAGMMNTLVHSNTNFYSQDDIFGDTASFFEFDTFRDNQFPELGIGDGYIIVPYSSNRSQTLKQYLATNPIIFNFLPAGYTFIFLSEYRTGYNTGVLQYDNFLDFRDPRYGLYPLEEGDIEPNPSPFPEYWEVPLEYHVDEELILDNGDLFTFTHTLYYYDPFIWRDTGYRQITTDYPRFTCDDLYYILPKYIQGQGQFHNLQEYLDYLTMVLEDEIVEEYKNGYEQNLNNTLFYKDIWLGDYLLSSLMGENWYPEYYDHVKGMQSIQAATYSYASLYRRSESLASQYFQREEKVISTADTLIQEHKREIISDRREIDLFRFKFLDDYSLWIILSSNDEYTAQRIIDIVDLDPTIVSHILETIPNIILDNLDPLQAETYYFQLVDGLAYSTIFAVKDGEGNIVYCNDGQHTTHTEVVDTDNVIITNSPSIGRSHT